MATARGRPRREEIDRAILDAAIELVCEGGFEATTIEAVAARAGVGRPTVYRRHAAREPLLEAAVRELFARESAKPARRDDPVDEVLALLTDTIRVLKRTPIGPVLRAALPHLPRNPALARLANELGGERRARLRPALDRCVEAGALPDQDLEALADGILGAIYFRYLLTGRRLDRAYARRLLVSLGRLDAESA